MFRTTEITELEYGRTGTDAKDPCRVHFDTELENKIKQ